MDTGKNDSSDGMQTESVRLAMVATAGTGVVFTLGGLVVWDLATGVGVLTGGVIAVGNLWAIRRIVTALLSQSRKKRGLWGLAAVFKFVGLLLVVAVLLRYDVVGLIPLLVGYAALPVGIAIAGLVASRVAKES